MPEEILKSQFEEIVEREADFNMGQLLEGTWPQIERLARVAPVLQAVRQNVSAKSYKKLAQAVVRAAFLIELVKTPKIETTKFRVRWCDQLDGDPRWCSFEECLDIASDLMAGLPEWLGRASNLESLLLAFENSVLPYEAPLDYGHRPLNGARIHTRGNVLWYCDDVVIRTLKLRKYLIDQRTSPDAEFFRKVITDKIKVKTYLTDRVLTGAHKTNREKRWETHPSSVHFAERRKCLAIEYALVTQICAFAGFPANSLAQLQRSNVLPANLTIAYCPITGEALSYEAFRTGVLRPAHGRSDFQVGHLNPLKLGAADAQGAGHTAENISWISADGNRIQGSLSLDDVRALMQRVADNYTTHEWWPKKERD